MGTFTALIIDDNKGVRASLMDLLDSNGFMVASCENGRNAETLLKNLYFDVILVDYRMPEMAGLETTKFLRRTCPESFFIGMSMENKEQEFREAGADAFIVKEMLLEELLPLINKRFEAKSETMRG